MKRNKNLNEALASHKAFQNIVKIINNKKCQKKTKYYNFSTFSMIIIVQLLIQIKSHASKK